MSLCIHYSGRVQVLKNKTRNGLGSGFAKLDPVVIPNYFRILTTAKISGGEQL